MHIEIVGVNRDRADFGCFVHLVFGSYLCVYDSLETADGKHNSILHAVETLRMLFLRLCAVDNLK